MDQGRDRRRALHRVRQPDVQRELRALAHRADEQQDADQSDVRGNRSCLPEYRGVIEAAEVREDQRDAQKKAEVADPVDEEGLQRGVDGALAGIPEADQQVGHQADRLPAEEQLQEVVRHHQHQHREGEQCDVGEEPLVARVVGHVADGVDVHHQRDEGHHHHHRHRQAVDEEADLEARPAAGQKCVDAAIKRISRQHIRKDPAGSQEGNQDRENRHSVSAGAAKEAGDDGARERRERHQ